jgi:hypothetical protein
MLCLAMMVNMLNKYTGNTGRREAERVYGPYHAPSGWAVSS